LIADEVMNEGTVDHAPVYPREVTRRALELSASAIILAHNHPSGDHALSPAEVAMIRQVTDAGNVMRVVGSDGVASLRVLALFRGRSPPCRFCGHARANATFVARWIYAGEASREFARSTADVPRLASECLPP
jgi:hypothetical protein